jgi:carbonic anhydrase
MTHRGNDYMCELNVLEQVANVCYTSIVQNAWRRGQELAVHGWIYDVKDGLLRDLDITVNALEQIPDVYRSSCEKVSALHQHK